MSGVNPNLYLYIHVLYVSIFKQKKSQASDKILGGKSKQPPILCCSIGSLIDSRGWNTHFLAAKTKHFREIIRPNGLFDSATQLMVIVSVRVDYKWSSYDQENCKIDPDKPPLH